MTLRYGCGLLLLLAAGCTQNNVETASQISLSDCPDIKNIDYLFENELLRVIVIGEFHGTKEQPALVEALLCHSISRGLKTGLAIEVSDEEGHHKTYFKSEGKEKDKQLLFNNWTWKSELPDGRSSQAMLALIDRGRLYQQAGAELKLTTFKADDIKREDYSDENSYMQAYEKKMAENILLSSKQADKTFVLVGNFHAKRGQHRWGDLKYDTMAQHMPTPYTESFVVAYKSGRAWYCQGPKPSDCSDNNTGGRVKSESLLGQSDEMQIIYNSDEKGIAPFTAPQYTKDGYDGVIYVGGVTASPPANAEGRIPYVEDKK